MTALRGQVAIVTGAASGIGAAIAARFAAEGARVLVVDIQDELGRKVASGLADAEFFHADVGCSADATAMIEAACNRLGRLDVLVSNAFAARPGRVFELDDASWALTLQVSLTGVFYGMRAAIPALRKTAGRLVNVASISGIGGDEGLAAYNAAKAGVLNLTRTTALEVAGDGIRVNAICPGLIDTPALQGVWERLPDAREPAARSVPLGRFGTPEEIASLALFLASAESSYLTGSAIIIDGGLTARSGIPGLVG